MSSPATVGGLFPHTTRKLRENAAPSSFRKPRRESSAGVQMRGHMGYVEISVDEGEDMKVVLHNNFRFLLRRLRVNDLQRHLVATWPNCSCGNGSLDDASFIRVLKAFFLFCLSLAIAGIFCEIYIASRGEIWNDQVFNLMQAEIVFLGLLTAIFAVIVLVRMKSRPSSEERGVEVKTISGDIQHLRLNDELNIKS